MIKNNTKNPIISNVKTMSQSFDKSQQSKEPALPIININKFITDFFNGTDKHNLNHYLEK
jgi:hypothetical protein